MVVKGAKLGANIWELGRGGGVSSAPPPPPSATYYVSLRVEFPLFSSVVGI